VLVVLGIPIVYNMLTC